MVLNPLRRHVLGLALLLGLHAAAAQTAALPGSARRMEADSPQNDAFDAAFDAAFERYHLPGLAVGIVQDGRIIYARTAGERVAGSGEAIDRQTLFKIASNTKAMTGALLARLIDQGRLGWDDPVIKHLPDFRMHEEWVTREMQVRDLLIHNSGLPAGAGDLMLWPGPNDFSRAEVIHGLRYLKPVASFRSRYAYDNTLYLVAGEVAAKAGGASWPELMRRELFVPLKLARCQVGRWDVRQIGNVAQPHQWRDGRNVAIGTPETVVGQNAMDPAGGVRCSLSDMLRWAQVWLDPATTDANGQPWLSAAQRKAVWTPQTLMPVSTQMREWDGSHVSAYGYGWRMADVDGVWKVSHTGTLSGMYSALTLLPDRRVGIVILINGEAEAARTVLSEVLVKQFTAPGPTQTVAHYAGLLDAAERASNASGGAKPSASRRDASARELSSWLGRWRDPWLGEVAICPAGRGVEFTAVKSPRLRGPVRMAGARPLVEWEDGAATDAWLDFKGGTPPTLAMRKVNNSADFSSDFEDLAFEKTGDCPQPPARASQAR